MAHATNDIQAVRETAGAGVLTLVDSLAVGGFVIITMASTISWKLTVIALLPMPIMAILTNYYGTLLHSRFHFAQEAFSHLNDKTQESINGIKVMKTFGQESKDVESFSKQSENVVEKNMSVAKVDSLFDPTISIIVGISFFLSIAFGSRFVMNDEMTLGELISFTTYLGLLIWPMLAFGWLFNIVERGRASYDRIQTLLREKSDIKMGEDLVDNQPIGSLEYQVEEFYYPDSETKALSQIYFTLNKGQTLGIVGKTGAGKTTLLKILMREYSLTNGCIIFANKSIEQYTLRSLRESIGYVPQDHYLFSMSVRDNIAFGVPNSTDEEVYSASKLAHIYEDIQDFTRGFHTMVGEKGVSLSGGQKQRISIARAILMQPELLVLDDSLSAVDAKTEEAILTSLKNNRKDQTTIITAHRMSAVQHADLIIVLDKGKIAERGTHEELMKLKGMYYDMYLLQQLESKVEEGDRHE